MATYLEHAEEAEELALRAEDPEERSEFERIAALWRALSHRAAMRLHSTGGSEQPDAPPDGREDPDR